MVTFKNHWDLSQWVETISIASFISVGFFFTHFLKNLRRKKKIWKRWSGQSEDNSIFAFTLLATGVELNGNGVETQDRQKAWMK